MQNRGLVVAGLVLSAAVLSARPAFAADDVSSEIASLKARLAEVEKKESANWLTEERKNEIKAIVKEVVDDAKARGAAGGGGVGYKDGFYITDGTNFKLVLNGFMQARYNYVYHRQASLKDSAPFAQGHQEESNGFDIRRARMSMSGFAFSPQLTFKLEGDFYAGSEISGVKLSQNNGTKNVTFSNTTTSGNFVVTDAFIAYAFSDQFKIKAGSYKVPFSKVELESDTNLSLMERPEVNSPFDALRSIGVSFYGDIIKDQLNYEVAINNGSNSNTFRRVDTANGAAVSTPPGANPNFNIDNRLAYYARMNWSPDGKIAEIMSGESDLRTGDRPFIWMLGAAVGMESQNANGAFAQNTTAISSLGNNNGPGYGSSYILNGDLYRATIDWSAKYAGWSFLTAAYFQQVNANPLLPGVTNGLPAGYGTVGGKTSFFQHAYYGQVGYMLTENWEAVARAGALLEEGDPNVGDFYTVGANYYMFKNNAKVQFDLTYAPEAAFSDGGATLIQNTHELAFRVQFQVKF